MKRFLIFTGSNYYPSGGFQDFAGQFDDLDSALAALKKSDSYNSQHRWWQIFDTRNMAFINEHGCADCNFMLWETRLDGTSGEQKSNGQ